MLEVQLGLSGGRMSLSCLANSKLLQHVLSTLEHLSLSRRMIGQDKFLKVVTHSSSPLLKSLTVPFCSFCMMNWIGPSSYLYQFKLQNNLVQCKSGSMIEPRIRIWMIWSYKWGLVYFLKKKACSLLQGSCEDSPLFSYIWTQIFFSWLLLRDRLNTINLLRRKNKHLDDYTSVLCINGPRRH